MNARPAPAAPRLLSTLAPWLIGAAFLIALPALFSTNSAITIMNQMAVTIVLALSYNMLLGQAGMLSFGHAVYMGFGGFAAVHLMNHMQAGALALPLPLLPLLGGLFSLGVATVIGAFSTRRAGVVFAMISLGVVELIASTAIITYGFFNGGGVGGDRTYATPVFGVDFVKQIEVYYLTIFWLMLSVGLMYLFTLTPMGRMANAVRDNPERAEFVGYSAWRVRLYSFCAAGFFAGVAGSMFAIVYEITTVENLNVQASGTVLMVAFLGGVGVFFGPIIGAVAFTLLQTVLSLHTDLWQLYVGVLFVATVMYFPGGLAGVMMMHAPAARRGRLAGLAGPYMKALIPAAAAILALVALAELLHHSRKAATGEEVMTLYWIAVDSHSPAPWIAALAVAVGGIMLARRAARGMAAAFAAATAPPV